jgi:hypothetical protein
MMKTLPILAEPEDDAQIRKEHKALKLMSTLKSWFNPNPSNFLKMQNSCREMIVERADFAFNTVEFVKDLESFEEAYHHPEDEKKTKLKRTIYGLVQSAREFIINLFCH